MAFWVHVEKGYIIFTVYFSSFKSLVSLESLARLLKKVLKSCETFKIQDFANASGYARVWAGVHGYVWVFAGVRERGA